MFDLEPLPDDDPEFLDMICKIIKGYLLSTEPDECYLVRIDNWFDHKWLHWRDGSHRANTEDDLKEMLAVPAFNPSRVIREYYLVAFGSPCWVQKPPTKQVHPVFFPDQYRRIKDLSESVVIGWFSGQSLASSRGSLMVYLFTPDARESWFASFTRKEAWVAAACKDISPEELVHFLGKGTH